jgi:hypothetical protein
MIKYNVKDIIERAEQLADLQNSDFISDSEKQALLNEAWSIFHQKIINSADKAFLRTASVRNGYRLPSDFLQMSAIYIRDSKEQIQRINAAQRMGYDIINDTLFLSKDYENLNVIMSYFPKPKTLFYCSGKKEKKGFTTSPKIIIDEDLYIDTSNNICSFSADTVVQPATVTGLMLRNGCLSVSDDVTLFKNYNGNTVESRETIPFVVRGNEVTYDTIKTDENLSNYMLYLTDKGNEQAYFVGKDLKLYTKDFEEVLQLTDSDLIYCRGDGLYIGNVGEGKIRRVLGNVVENFPLSLFGFNAFVDDFSCIVSMSGNYYKTAYGFSTILDYPNNIYYTVLAYSLAISFKLKQNGDTSVLSGKYEEALSQFYDSIQRDDNGSYTIRNVYANKGRIW